MATSTFYKRVALFVFEFIFGAAAEAATRFRSGFRAARAGTVEDIQTFINAGFDVNARDKDGMTPLMYAARYNTSAEVIEALTQAGADVEARDYYGMTPLMFAARNSSVEIIEALIKAGANINAREKRYGSTPLMEAAYSNKSDKSAEIMEALIKAGSDVNAQNNYGDTALTLAEMRNTAEVINVLEKAVTQSGTSSFKDIFEAVRHGGAAEVIMQMIKAGADVNARDEEGATPLMLAAEYSKSVAVIEALIKAGADVNAQDNEMDWTPLMYAAKYNKSIEVMEALL